MLRLAFIYPKHFLGVPVEDEIQFLLREPQRLQLFQFVSGVPHGVIRTEKDAVGPVAVDQFPNPRRGQEALGRRTVHIEIGNAVKLRCLVPDGICTEVGTDNGEAGIGLQNGDQTIGVGVVIAGITCMDEDGQSPLAKLKHFEAAVVIQLEGLNIRVEFHALETKGNNLFHVPPDIVALSMKGTDSGKAAVAGRHLSRNEAVDGTHLMGRGGHGADHKMVHPRSTAGAQQGFAAAVQHGVAVIKTVGTGHSLGRNFRRIDMAMAVDNAVFSDHDLPTSFFFNTPRGPFLPPGPHSPPADYNTPPGSAAYRESRRR